MANLNIKFNNKSYSIDPASLADALASLEGHLAAMVDEPVGEKKFKTILCEPDGNGAFDFCEYMINSSEGLISAVNEGVLQSKTTDVIITTANDYHLYYIEDENGIYIYGDFTGTDTYEWMNYSVRVDIPFNGAISDISEATELGYYALIYYDTPDGDVAL
jgi:hypothetical protein